MAYTLLTKKELKTKCGIDFKEGDIVEVGKYLIHIEYGQYSIPSLKSWVENSETGKKLSAWPAGCRGCWPYFIQEFLGRKPAEQSVNPT